MAKGKALTAKEKAKVISAKLKNPDASSKDLEKETGIPERTANRIINEDLAKLGESKVERIARIVANDSETVENMSELAKIFSGNLLRKAKLDLSSVFNSEIKLADEITANSFKRKQLLD